ncbi:gliding motility protein RemB [Flavobacteriales bacterium]|nr:gliding motility protein RemB [Flavobacteriales bacterium]
MRFLSFSFLFFALNLSAQHSGVFLGNNYSSNFNHLIYNENSNYHTSFKSLLKSDLKFDVDSVLEERSASDYSNWYLKKIFSDHFIILKGEDYRVIASPIINLSKGKELIEDKNTFTNTRGFIVEGDLGKKISFFSSFSENQSIFPNYMDAYIRKNRVVPGQGYARDFKETGFDYAMSSGYVSYRVNKMFAAQFGHGKHFIGDGYRSLLLSDNTFNYPYLRLQTTFWKVQYTNLYTEFQDINYFLNNGLDNYDQMGYAKKYMSSHYLSINATKKLNISLYEAVIWRMNHAPGSNGFDVNYLNPIAMLRPLEYSINSPDNVLVGLNAKYKLPFSSYLYGQLILDEFSLNDLKQNNDFWANKFGYQLGYKIFNAFRIENLTLQTEYNLVRPYTYAHHNPQQNYAHYNQQLAHPLGANFSEFLILANYKWKRWEIDAKLISAKYGAKIKGDATSYGNDLFMSTGNFASESGFQNVGVGRPSDFGIEMYQGNLTTVNLKNFNIAYVVNPRTNLKINLGVTLRDFENEESEMQTQFINFGIVSDLFNHYYDF